MLPSRDSFLLPSGSQTVCKLAANLKPINTNAVEAEFVSDTTSRKVNEYRAYALTKVTRSGFAMYVLFCSGLFAVTGIKILLGC